MVNRLAGKVAIVTGGGSGIGRATALLFSQKGAQVFVSATTTDRGQHTIHTIEEAGGAGFFAQVDVTQTVEVETMITRAVETYGRIDCACNNAGVAPIGLTRIADCAEDEWDRVVGINLKGVFLCMKYELRQMLKQGSGAIVNTASIMGLVGTGSQDGGASSYLASKHGVVGLTKAAALEYAQDGIRVNAVCPGFVHTPIIQDILSDPQSRARIVDRHPVGRLGIPEEIAETVVWLCSDAASFVTGHAMAVDGGYIAQ